MCNCFLGIVYCFNVPQVDKAIEEKAQSSGVEIKHFNIIYELIDDLKEEMTKRLPPIRQTNTLGG